MSTNAHDEQLKQQIAMQLGLGFGEETAARLVKEFHANMERGDSEREAAYKLGIEIRLLKLERRGR